VAAGSVGWIAAACRLARSLSGLRFPTCRYPHAAQREGDNRPPTSAGDLLTLAAAGTTSDNRLRGFDEPATSTRAGHGRVQMDQSGQPVGRAAADQQTVLVQTSYGLVPIGWVQSALRVLDDAPNQRQGAPRAWIRFDEQVAEGAKDLRPGDEIVVLTWLHLSPRDELSTHPEDDMRQPLTGVFSTCSPNRPDPIGLHRARIVTRAGLRIEVDALEAIDGTPVVDVKPAIDPPA
jgi:tRNA-Thr(GGU) m(6)t(6)A37 methyltransferase TsaA